MTTGLCIMMHCPQALPLSLFCLHEGVVIVLVICAALKDHRRADAGEHGVVLVCGRWATATRT